MIIAILLATIIGLRWYNSSLDPVNPDDTDLVLFEVSSGSGTNQIIDRLEQEGLIKSSLAANIYLRFHSDQSGIQAGSFKLSPSMSTKQVLATLAKAIDVGDDFTIIPGKRIDEIRASMIDFGFNESEVDLALNPDQYRNDPIGRYWPDEADLSLEGYLYPETFATSSQTTPESIIRQSLSEMARRLDDEFQAKAAKVGLSVHEAVTLASIIEMEVSNSVDKPIVSQVFHSRLDLGMPLGSDVTFFYAAEVFGGRASPSLDNPYNTRLYGGLPPGPIANFGQASLEAAVEPSSTSYLYFVAGDDGNTYYSYTLAEHNQNVAEHCIELCKLP